MALELLNDFISALITFRVDLPTFLFLLLLFALPVEFLLRRVPGSQTHAHLLTLIRSRKPIPWFDRHSVHTRFLHWFGILGILLGFGVIASDYLWGRGKPLPQRILINTGVLVLMGLLFSLLLGNNVQATQLIADYEFLVLLSFGFMGLSGFILSTLLFNGFDILIKLFITQQEACPGVAPLFPGVEVPGVPLSIPVYVWLLFFPMLIIHEAFHGLLARMHKVTVKSTGVVFLSFLPFGAFVDLDEQQMARMDGKKSLQILSVGAFSNIVTFLIAGIIAALLIYPLLLPPLEALSTQGTEALVIASVSAETTFCGDEYPNSAFGTVEEGDIIHSLNGEPIRTLFDYQRARVLDGNEALLQYTDVSENQIHTRSFSYNSLGLIGIQVEEQSADGFERSAGDALALSTLQLLAGIIGWFIVLNFLIGAANYLPIVPFDGGRMAKILFAPYFGFLQMPKEDTERLVGRLFLWVLIILLLINILPIFVAG